jgi:hypothetical protein
VRRALAALTLLMSVVVGEAWAGERVDLELVLLADASRSIDDAEIMFQRRGYATAITDRAVLLAIARGGYEGRIAVTYVEWGDETSQEVVVPWTMIDGPESAAAFAKALLETPRLAFGPNAIGSALAAAHVLIRGDDVAGARRVIDFSADSAYSFGGVAIAEARAAALLDGIVINGLAILCRSPECSGRPVGYDLEAAFAQIIVGGPGAFVITADGPQSFAEAVRRKLLLEIAGGKPAAPKFAER